MLKNIHVPGVSLTLQLTATILRITRVCILPGAAIFFEFKHYKPKKKFTSTKCFAFMEMDEIKPGPIVVELWVDPFCLPRLFLFFPFKSNICPPELQVQEAHRLQEEETATADQEAAVPPPPSDATHRQLRARRLQLLKHWGLLPYPPPPHPATLHPVSTPRHRFNSSRAKVGAEFTLVKPVPDIVGLPQLPKTGAAGDVCPDKRPHTCVL